jgi:hypothetical protein
MPIQISFSDLALEQKRRLIEKYPGLGKHFSHLEGAIATVPLSGTVELMPNRNGQSIPVYTLAAKTEIFSGAASYSKELIGVYVYSKNLQMARVIQFLF